MNFRKLIRRLSKRATINEAYAAGRDAKKHGPNIKNCSFRFFASKEITKAWEDGNRYMPEDE